MHGFLKECVPMKTAYKYSYPQWFSPEMISLLKKQARFHKLSKIFPHSNFYTSQFQNIRTTIKDLIKHSYLNYIQDCETSILLTHLNFGKKNAFTIYLSMSYDNIFSPYDNSQYSYSDDVSNIDIFLY